MSINPSLALIPCAFNTGKLYSVLPQDGTGDFTVSRNGNATYFDKDGILRTALPNEPRFDFDPLTGEFRGVLVEPSRTNTVISSQMTGAVVGNIGSGGALPPGFNILILSGLTLRVDAVGVNSKGYTYIDLRYFGAASGVVAAITFMGTTQVPATNGQTWSYSIFVNRSSGTPNHRITFSGRNNVGNLAQSLPDQTVPVNNTNILTQTNTLTNVNVNFIIFGLSVDLVVGQFYDFTTRIYAPQLELGSTRTSYIQTTGSQVTRPADQITVTVPMGATQCVYILNGTQVTVPVTGGSTFTLPNGRITQLYMI